jgi:hypothetical protein|nr:MAG TPA: hypothetical protein [Caudoviricetes sp.]
MNEYYECAGCEREKLPCVIRICGNGKNATEADRRAYEKCIMLNRVNQCKTGGKNESNVGR